MPNICMHLFCTHIMYLFILAYYLNYSQSFANDFEIIRHLYVNVSFVTQKLQSTKYVDFSEESVKSLKLLQHSIRPLCTYERTCMIICRLSV